MKQRLIRFWESYKYRFVPWIAANLKSRSARCVEASKDNIIPESVATSSLVKLFTALNENEKLSPPFQHFTNSTDRSYGDVQRSGNNEKYFSLSTEESNSLKIGAIQNSKFLNIREKFNDTFLKNRTLLHIRRNLQLCLWSSYHHFSTLLNYMNPWNWAKCQAVLGSSSCHGFPRRHQWIYSSAKQVQDHFLRDQVEQRSETGSEGCRGSHQNDPSDVMLEVFKFNIECKPSHLPGGGTGVFVGQAGLIPKHHIVAMYPGTIYLPSEPILLQSLGNPFIFRCSDGLLIDGNDKRISKMIYKSCSRRDRIAPNIASSDLTWTTDHPQNPLSIGQYVNNHSKDIAANVAYQECNIDHQFPLRLRKYLPNVFYTAGLLHQRPLRTVVLVSLRDIKPGEELLSSYFTLIH